MDDRFGKRVGGRLCLDFVNTVRGRISNPPRPRGRNVRDGVVGERLRSYEALLRWGTLVGVLTTRQARVLARDASMRPSDAATVLDRAIRLREAMYRVLEAAIKRWRAPDDDLAVLNRELKVARAHERLVVSPHPAWKWDDARAGLDSLLWPIVRSAVELLTSRDLARVGQCPGEQCGWLFLDTSRSRRRTWCDMADCGTRAKVRRFREKRRRTV